MRTLTRVAHEGPKRHHDGTMPLLTDSTAVRACLVRGLFTDPVQFLLGTGLGHGSGQATGTIIYVDAAGGQRPRSEI